MSLLPGLIYLLCKSGRVGSLWCTDALPLPLPVLLPLTLPLASYPSRHPSFPLLLFLPLSSTFSSIRFSSTPLVLSSPLFLFCVGLKFHHLYDTLVNFDDNFDVKETRLFLLLVIYIVYSQLFTFKEEQQSRPIHDNLAGNVDMRVLWQT